MLSLLLELSDSPMKQHYEKKERHLEEKKKVIESWNDVLNEEPLEGNHWQQWDDMELDEDSMMMENKSDEFELDSTYDPNKKNRSASQNDSIQTYWEDDNNEYYIKQLQSNSKPISDDSIPITADQLYHEQYWHKNSRQNENEKVLDINSSLLQKASLLNTTLNQYNRTKSSPTECRYIKEQHAIREILFFLRGYETVIFKRSEQDNPSTISSIFYFNSNYSINHLSSQSFSSIMNTFCQYGNILYRLRRHVKRTVYVRKNGQTYQAFSVAISNALNDFEYLLAGLEMKYMALTTSDSKEIHSLLQLYEELQRPLSCLSAVHDTLLQCSNLVSSNSQSNTTNARMMSTLLLSTLFKQIVNAEMSGNDCIYKTMCTIFKQTLSPYSRLMDEWVFQGTLENDIANEFFVTRNTQLNDYSPLYWSDGFIIGATASNTNSCPLFSFNFTKTILFVGKAINLCKQIDQSFSITHNEYSSLENILSQRFTISKQHLFINEHKNTNTILAESTIKDIHDDTDSSFIIFGVPKIKTQHSYGSINEKEKHSSNTLFNYDFDECLQQYIKKPYEDSTSRLIAVLQKNKGFSYHLEILTVIYFMLESNLMHSFCEAIFIQMDKKQHWYDRVFLNQAFSDACKLINSQQHMLSTRTINIKMKLDKDDLNIPRKTTFPAGFKAISTASYLDQLTIDYEIPWPLNNFIKPDCMKYYDKVMHLLLRIKRSKHVLEKKTLLDKQDNKYTNLNTNSSHSAGKNNKITRLYVLRMQMIWFINSFWRYIMTTVIHADTMVFKEQIANINDIDKMILLHDQYIMGIIDKCLLNDKSASIKKAIVHIFDMVEQLADMFSQSSTENIDKPLKVLEQDYQRTSNFISTTINVMKSQVNLNWFDILSTSLSL
ncbi:unnamed protein product [Cunninghamella echinulata]